MNQLVLSQKAKSMISLRSQMKEMDVCTKELQIKINAEFGILLDDTENQIIKLQQIKKEILYYIEDIPEENVVVKEEAPEAPEVKEIETKTVEIKLTKETAYKVTILDINSGTVVFKNEKLSLKFKGKQKVGQDAFVFDWYGSTEKGWISNHVLYTGTTYLDRKFGKLYIVTKDGITSAKISVLEKYIVEFGKEVLIGDGMSIVNPNYLKIKAGLDINFV